MQTKPPKLMDHVASVMMLRHYSPKTHEAYAQWIKRFIVFHNKSHPRDMGESEIRTFLSYLAEQRHVSALLARKSLIATNGTRKNSTLIRNIEILTHTMVEFGM